MKKVSIVGEFVKEKLGVRHFKGLSWEGYKYIAYGNGLHYYIRYRPKTDL